MGLRWLATPGSHLWFWLTYKLVKGLNETQHAHSGWITIAQWNWFPDFSCPVSIQLIFWLKTSQTCRCTSSTLLPALYQHDNINVLMPTPERPSLHSRNPKVSLTDQNRTHTDPYCTIPYWQWKQSLRLGLPGFSIQKTYWKSFWIWILCVCTAHWDPFWFLAQFFFLTAFEKIQI